MQRHEQPIEEEEAAQPVAQPAPPVADPHAFARPGNGMASPNALRNMMLGVQRTSGNQAAQQLARRAGEAEATDPQIEASLAKIEKELPADVKTHKVLHSRELRVMWLKNQRAYFGTDDKTIEHFKGIREAKIPNVGEHKTLLADEAAARIEAVYDEIGKDEMPKSRGVAWPRSISDEPQGLKAAHNLGHAIDFNATEMPFLIKAQKQKDLIKLMTGEDAKLKLGPGFKSERTYAEGKAATAERGKMDEDAALKALLDRTEAETKRMSNASEKFRGSLSQTVDGKVIDGRAQLVALRSEYHAAKKGPARDDVMKKLPATIKPWLDAIDKELKGAPATLKECGLDPASKPTDGDMGRLYKSLKAQKDKLGKARAGLSDNMTAKQQAKLAKAVEAGRAAIDPAAATAPPLAAMKPGDLLAEARRLEALADKRMDLTGKIAFQARLPDLKAALGDATFVFGASAKDTVATPSAGQLVKSGFFTLREFSKQDTAVTPAFIRAMVKHGFTPGATWDAADSMHFEIRWRGPGMK